MLEAVWENAVKLAMNHVPERIGEVVGIVTKRLVEISRHAQARPHAPCYLLPGYHPLHLPWRLVEINLHNLHAHVTWLPPLCTRYGRALRG